MPERLSDRQKREQALQYLQQRLFALYPQDHHRFNHYPTDELLISYDLFSNDSRFSDLEENVNRGIFDYERFYTEIRTKLTDQEVMIKLIADYGEKKGPDLATRIEKELGKDFIRLLIEPALATKLDVFIKFCKIRNFSSPEEARQQFIAELAQHPEVAYRVMSLTPNELTTVQEQGMDCGTLRKKKDPTHKYTSKTLVGEAFTGLKYIASNHLSSFTIHSSLVSLSAYPEMAKMASENFLRRRTQEGKEAYLFKLSLNPYFIIRFGNVLENTLNDEKLGYGKVVHRTWILPNKKIPGNDPNVEMFAEWSIPASAIQEVRPLQLQDLPNVEFKKGNPAQVLWREVKRFFGGK